MPRKQTNTAVREGLKTMLQEQGWDAEQIDAIVDQATDLVLEFRQWTNPTPFQVVMWKEELQKACGQAINQLLGLDRSCLDSAKSLIDEIYAILIRVDCEALFGPTNRFIKAFQQWTNRVACWDSFERILGSVEPKIDSLRKITPRVIALAQQTENISNQLATHEQGLKALSMACAFLVEKNSSQSNMAQALRDRELSLMETIKHIEVNSSMRRMQERSVLDLIKIIQHMTLTIPITLRNIVTANQTRKNINGVQQDFVNLLKGWTVKR